MAVSMNAGGYMRSDFMISDAAIPMRMEDLDAEAAKFAQILSTVDNTGSTPLADAAPVSQTVPESAVQTIAETLPQEYQTLAEKIAEGEISLDELPKELVTDELIKAVLSVKKQKSEKEPEDNAVLLSDAAGQAAQLAAGFVQTDIPADMTDELSEIAAAVAVEETQAVKLISEFITDADMMELAPADSEAQFVSDEAIPDFAADEGKTQLVPEKVRTEDISDTAETELVSNPAIMVPASENGTAKPVPDDGTVKPIPDDVTEKPVPDDEITEFVSVTAATELVSDEGKENLPADRAEVPVKQVGNADSGNSNRHPEAVQTPVNTYPERMPQQNVTEQYVQEQSVQQIQTERISSVFDQVQLTTEQTRVINLAAANAEISEVMVKPVLRSTAEKETETVMPEVQQSLGIASRIKPVGEELEMLRSAKQRPEAAPASKTAEALTEETADLPEILRTEQPVAEGKPQQPENMAGAEKQQADAGETRQVPIKAQGRTESAEQPLKPEQTAEEQTIPTEKTAKAEQTVKSEEPAQVSSKPAQSEVPTEQTYSPDQPVIFIRRSGEEIEVTPREIISQAAVKLEETVREMTGDSTEYSIVLNPEELGRITVKLTKAADGAVSVTIAAENERTQRILEQNSQLMQNDLKNSGVRLESWQTVNETQQDNQAQDYNGSSKNPYRREEQPHNEADADDTSFADIMAAM